MNIESDIAELVRLSIALGFGWVLVCLCWRNYKTDALRESFFALREELFDYAAHGGIDFGHPAYIELRHFMNSMIRFAHKVSFGRLALILIMHRASPVPVESNSYLAWRRTVEALPIDQKKKLLDFHSRFLVIVVRHVLITSPVLWILLILGGIWVALHGAAKRMIEAVAEGLAWRLPGLHVIEAYALGDDPNAGVAEG